MGEEMKYVSRPPQSRWVDELDCEVPDYPAPTVYETDKPTGLVDQHGNDIVKVMGPIGFRFKPVKA